MSAIAVPPFCVSFAREVAAKQPAYVLVGPVMADAEEQPCFVVLYGTADMDKPESVECNGDRIGQAGLYRAGIVAALMGTTYASLHVFGVEAAMIHFAAGLWPREYASLVAAMEVQAAGGSRA